MTLYIKDTDIRIRGTLEQMQGCAAISGLNDDGTLRYTGEIKVFDDSTETIFRNGRPVWIGVENDYEEFHGVDVEDRREEDGTVIAYAGVTDDAVEDELVDLLNLVIAKATTVKDAETLSKEVRICASTILMHATNLEAGLNKMIRPARGEDV